MEWQGWFTLAVIALVFGAMVRGMGPPDIILWGGTVLLGLAGIISAEDVVSGFANKSMLTIGALFVVAAAMRETGALDRIGTHMMGRAKSEEGALVRLAPQLTALSAFLNNTAVVAMVIPVVNDWCRKMRVSPSRLLIPIAYFAIMGGTCTLIGTSRNLIVSDLMIDASHWETLSPAARESLAGGMKFFELAWLGVPLVLCGFAYLLGLGRHWLPNRTDMLEKIGDSAREFMVDVIVDPSCPLVGKTIAEAGLRHLPGLFLVEIERGERAIAPVEPDEVLNAGDRLVFAGVISTIVDLERIPGLRPALEERDTANAVERRRRRYCEAVISRTSPLVGINIRDANFRARYNAAVIAVHRGRRRVTGRIGDILLRAGDTLLLQAGPHFVDANRNNPDFFLVSSVQEARPVRHERAWTAFALLALLVTLMVLPSVPVVLAAFTVAGLMIVSRCISAGDARRAVQWDVLLVIAAAFGLGHALEKSGAAAQIGHLVASATVAWGPQAALAAVYVITVVFGILVSSNATAVLMFPIALTVAQELNVDPRPFAIAVTASASASFASPIAYQTNMLVYGPGGYRFSDFLRVGLPLNVLMAVVTILLIPLIWPFALPS